jgi:hypothetical protein
MVLGAMSVEAGHGTRRATASVMLLVFLARMVDDLVADVVASATTRSKALIGRSHPTPPPARVELVPARPNGIVHWVEGDWQWNGSHWSWLGGHWSSTAPSKKLSMRRPAPKTTPVARPVLMLAAAGSAR